MAVTIQSILGRITYTKKELRQNRVYYRRMEERKTRARINKLKFAKGNRDSRIMFMKDIEHLPSFQKQLKRMKSMFT